MAVYRGGGLKLGMSMKQWDWDIDAQANGTETYLGIMYEMWTHTSEGGLLNYSQTEDSVVINLTIANFPFAINMDKGMIFDGEPSLAGSSRNNYRVPVPALGNGLWTVLEFNQGFCSADTYPFIRFTNLTYDPSIVTLFATDPTLPNGRSSKGNNKTIGIAVGVTFGVILFLVIVAIILVLTVPSVRNIVRPYSKRRAGGQNVQLDSSGPHSRSAGWTSGAKPSSK